MDARLCDQPHHSLVAAFVLLAHVLHQVEQQLAAQHLVPVHPSNVAELRLSWRGRRKPDRRSVRAEVASYIRRLVRTKMLKSKEDGELQVKEPFHLHLQRQTMITFLLSRFQRL